MGPMGSMVKIHGFLAFPAFVKRKTPSTLKIHDVFGTFQEKIAVDAKNSRIFSVSGTFKGKSPSTLKIHGFLTFPGR